MLNENLRTEVSKQTASFINALEKYIEAESELISALSNQLGDKRAEQIIENEKPGQTLRGTRRLFERYVTDSITSNIGSLDNKKQI